MIPPYIPKSDKLDEKYRQRETHKAKSKDAAANMQRLNKSLHPQWLDSTVVRVTDVEAPTATLVGFKPLRDQASIVTTGLKDQDEAARKADILKRTLAGESIAHSATVSEQLEKEQRERAAQEIAIEFLEREIEKEKTALAIEYVKTLRPKHDEQMRQLCKALLDVHAAWTEVYGLKRHLIDSSVGLRGLCLTMPDFLGSPNDAYSDMAAFFTAAKREGWIKEIPQSLRMKVAK
jgi:hypothetical protein